MSEKLKEILDKNPVERKKYADMLADKSRKLPEKVRAEIKQRCLDIDDDPDAYALKLRRKLSVKDANHTNWKDSPNVMLEAMRIKLEDAIADPRFEDKSELQKDYDMLTKEPLKYIKAWQEKEMASKASEVLDG